MERLGPSLYETMKSHGLSILSLKSVAMVGIEMVISLMSNQL